MSDIAGLFESQEFLRLVHEGASDGFILVDDQGVIVWANRAMGELRGLPLDQMVGRPFLDLSLGEEREKYLDGFSRMLRGESLKLRTRTVTPLGQERILDVNAAPVEIRGRRYGFSILRDVTESARAEQEVRRANEELEGRVTERTAALQVSEERFRRAFDNAAAGMCLVGIDGRFLRVNPYLCRMLGYEEGDLLALTFRDLTHPDDLSSSGEILRRAMSGEVSTFELEKRYLHREGHVVWGHLTTSLLRDPEGKPLYFVSQIVDITRRKRAEQALRQSEERFRAISEATPVAVIITRVSDGTLLFVNEAAAREVSVPREQAVGRSAIEFYGDPGDRAALMEKLRLGEAIDDYEMRLQRPDGTRVWASASLRLMTFQGEPAILGAFIDITARKEAQEELRKAHDDLELRIEERTTLLSRELSERRRIEEHLRLYREIFAHATEGILILDREGRFLEQNEAHRRMLGYSDEELRADPPNLRTEGGPRVLEALLGRGVFLGEVVNRAKDGRVLHVELSAFPVRGASEEVLCTVAIKRDVTARREAEDALRASEERWRSLVENAPGIILTVDREGKIQSINRALEGYRREDVVGSSVFDFLAKGSEERVRAALDSVFQSGTPTSFETPGGGPHGSLAWWDSQVGPITIDGKVAAAVIVATDITARKEAEQKLAGFAEEQGLLLAHSSDFVYRHDTRGVFTYMSPAVEQITGYSVREWMTHYTEYMTDHPVNRKVIEYTEETLRTGKQSPPYLVEVFGKGGKRILLEVNERAYHEDGRIAGIIGTARDVTERSKAEEEIRFQKTLLESQAEASIDGILVVSAEGRMISFNRRFVEMWGIPAAVVESRSDEAALQSVLAKLSDPEGFLARVRYLYDRPYEESRDEITLKDGRTFDRYSAPVRSRDGVFYGRVWHFRDVTGRKHTELELRRAAEETRRAYEDLKEAQSQLIRSEKLASIGMLVSGVAHEINNPLNVMYGNLQLLEEGADAIAPLIRKTPGLPRGVRRFRAMVRDALKAARHARGVIEDFRGYARDVRTAEVVDLNRCLEETLALVQPHLRSGIRVVRNFGEIPPLRCVRGQVSQVFLNLLKNAAEAIEKGKGTITLRTRRRERRAVVEVADTGRGMTDEVRKKLFEPFFTTKAVGKGLGLGLSISAMIVQNHGGQMSVTSRPGRGSVFRVEIPIRD